MTYHLYSWETAYLQRPTSHITERANSDTVDSTDGVAKPGNTESAIGPPTTAIHTANDTLAAREQRATSLAPLSLRLCKARTNGKPRGWTGWVEGDKPTPRFPINSYKLLVLECGIESVETVKLE
ncbi:hypothetical protein EXIGLDRAFT_783047 [Exidia glandulosa HHB12029]|uniref:Uncharacterized protein n=1 Tax=Exidia glandulosa HHB12029 TaxID=1314781 RepID=A0A166NA89_EXIGL|nr:hypothetical protein EXIGLDRAFT_783047 [Exidia glandulosa HHB12029]